MCTLGPLVCWAAWEQNPSSSWARTHENGEIPPQTPMRPVVRLHTDPTYTPTMAPVVSGPPLWGPHCPAKTMAPFSPNKFWKFLKISFWKLIYTLTSRTEAAVERSLHSDSFPVIQLICRALAEVHCQVPHCYAQVCAISRKSQFVTLVCELRKELSSLIGTDWNQGWDTWGPFCSVCRWVPGTSCSKPGTCCCSLEHIPRKKGPNYFSWACQQRDLSRSKPRPTEINCTQIDISPKKVAHLTTANRFLEWQMTSGPQKGREESQAPSTGNCVETWFNSQA
jgi:hypothetical protein